MCNFEKVTKKSKLMSLLRDVDAQTVFTATSNVESEILVSSAHQHVNPTFY